MSIGYILDLMKITEAYNFMFLILVSLRDNMENSFVVTSGDALTNERSRV